jgi:hypothetical protein
VLFNLEELKKDITKDQMEAMFNKLNGVWLFSSTEEFYREFLFKSISSEIFEKNGIDQIHVRLKEHGSLQDIMFVISENENNYTKIKKDKRLNIDIYSVGPYGQHVDFHSSLIESIFVGQGLVFVKSLNGLEDMVAMKLVDDNQMKMIMQKGEKVLGPEDADA